MISFAGIRSDEMNLVVEHYPSRSFPERSYEVIEVPGRNGDVIIDNGNFKNYRESYSVFIDSGCLETPRLQLIARNLAGWLLGNPGYQRLEDSYDPEFYRMAYYSGGSNFSNFFNIYGRGTLEFICAPKRFSKEGDREISAVKSEKLINPFVFKAEPIYKISVSGSNPTITVNGNDMSFSVSSGTIYVDVEKHKTYNSSGNRISEDGDYEDLVLTKSNTFNWNGSVSSLKLTPRWWIL